MPFTKALCCQYVEVSCTIPFFSVSMHYDLKWFSPLNIVWALPPAVATKIKIRRIGRRAANAEIVK